jgi:S1-C subfamily serine protease
MSSLKVKNKTIMISGLVICLLVATACAPLTAIANLPQLKVISPVNSADKTVIEEEVQKDSQPSNADEVVDPVSVAALEGTLTDIYNQVNPSVVSIQVTSSAISSVSPFSPNGEQIPQVQSVLGSGFVWDDEGHIVTNNHVISDATDIEVVFDDGTSYSAELVGADSDSDLAVIKIDEDASALTPLSVTDSDSVQVGDLAIAIGNPYGLGGTMTVGIVSALGRSLEAESTSLTGSYTIPDIIQTDAAINPGNSGGVLLNAGGQVIGVTAAIESPVEANVGIGFVIPSNIVLNVVPELIESGAYEHSYLGITGTSLFSDLAEAMGLDRNQHGILVSTVIAGGPADDAGIRGSGSDSFNYQGTQIDIGGDIITAINDTPTPTFDELVSYLASDTRPGDQIALDILRDGKTITVDVTLQARPNSETVDNTEPPTSAFVSGQAYLGITGGSLVPEVAQAMGLDSDQEGVLVVGVASDSPAEEANLRGSSEPFTLNGQEMKIGGDVIIKIDRTKIDGIQTLREQLAEYEPGDEITLTILRDGEQIEVMVTLSERP